MTHFQLYFAIFIISIYFVKSDQWLFQSEAKWDKEWKSGSWDYMEKVAVERSKVSVIGGVLVQMYSHANASVLDVGCGEGPISDFLLPSQKAHYVGIDISKEAILSAKKLRGPPLKFVHATSHLFQPKNKFDVIIFSDMLYYVEYEKVLKQYEGYLNPGGIVIISIFHQEKSLYENIWSFARQTFDQVSSFVASHVMSNQPIYHHFNTIFTLFSWMRWM
jgi:2-polyprenyl-3-methyl-5-hydroxy-6-metoxy-1,4-benzoquinol methylase